MYIIDKSNNRIKKINEKSFSDLGFKEREHLQEWIANEPSCLGEKLLIIQKEFSDFDDTKERLDLLALDEKGNLVIIENKLDDSGRDVTWQALKYASYCSGLKKEEIINIYQKYLKKEKIDENAQKKLEEFFGDNYDNIILNNGSSQRIIFIAANFKKEVTSTVLWLMNFGLNIQCFKVKPFEMDGKLLLDIEQIIPIKDAEEFMIKVAAKAQENYIEENNISNLDNLRFEFWNLLLNEINKKTALFQNIHAQMVNWISTSSGVSGLSYIFVANKDNARVEFYIDIRNKAENEKIFDLLFTKKKEIEDIFGDELNWRRIDESRACIINYGTEINFLDKENWTEIIEFLTKNMVRLEKAFSGQLTEVGKMIKEK